MRTSRTLILAVLLALVAVGCGDDDTSTEGSTTGEDSTSEETEGTPGGSEDGADPEPDSGDEPGGPSDAAATVTVSDGSTWEFTEILECEIGEDGSPDYREFIGETSDGAAKLAVSYFPEAELAGLSGVSIDAEVDGNDWTYSDSYAGESVFDVSLRSDGADGSAPARVVGIDSPDADLTIDWSFTC